LVNVGAQLVIVYTIVVEIVKVVSTGAEDAAAALVAALDVSVSVTGQTVV
jgi:hypothetical protein